MNQFIKEFEWLYAIHLGKKALKTGKVIKELQILSGNWWTEENQTIYI